MTVAEESDPNAEEGETAAAEEEDDEPEETQCQERPIMSEKGRVKMGSYSIYGEDVWVKMG